MSKTGTRKFALTVKGAGILAAMLIIGALFVWMVQHQKDSAIHTKDLPQTTPPANRTTAIVKSTAQVALTPEEKDYLTKLGSITVCPDPDWVPYERMDENGDFSGIAADLMHLVAQRLDISFTYVIAKDWDEAVALSQAGKILILPFLNQTPAREKWLIFSDPLFIDPNVFITREEHPFISDPTTLTDKTIVFPSGTSVEERVRRDFPHLTVVNVPTENEVFQAVSSRKADMTMRSLTLSAYTIRKEGLFNLKIAGQAPDSYINRLRLGIRMSEPMLRDILNKGIATITPSERDEIVNSHINITVVKPMDYGFILRIAAVLTILIIVSYYWNFRLKKINAALNESERSKSVLLSNLPGIAYRCRYDRNRTMEFISEGCLKLTGYNNEALLYNHLISYNDLIVPEERETIWQAWEQAKASHRPVQLEYRIITADKKEKWVFEQGVFVYDNDNNIQAIEGLIIDITARKRAEEELYRTSIYDHLTGIYNRRFIFTQLDTLILEYQREGRDFSLSVIDLDFFKKINDTHGHPAGDFLLKEFAVMLAASVRPYDLVGRYGGEEFIVVTMNSAGEQTHKMLMRLREMVKARIFDFNGIHLQIAFSAGIINSGDLPSEVTVEKMISKADERLYLAKAQGRDRIISQ